ncbi:MAG: agmatine deiminase family protein [Candidatus Eisenbacteria bacterium]
MGSANRSFVVIAVVLLVAAFVITPDTQAGSTKSPDTQPSDLFLEELPIHLTEEEMTRLDEIGITHITTAAPGAPVRRCAQWEPLTGALIRYYNGFGLPVAMIRGYAEDLTVHILCISSQQTTCYNYLNSNGVNMANVDMIDISTNSMWTRDYGPQTVFADGAWGFVDHIYNRPRPLDDQVPWDLGSEWSAPVYGTTLVHTGGNFLFDGHGTGFSTDLVWDENSGMTHTEIAQVMEDYLGITNYVVLPDIASAGIHHIDCWLKVLSEETLLVKEVASSHAHYAAIEANVATLGTLTNCYGRPYNIVRVYCGGIGGGQVAAYTNSMILNNKVFVPLFGISTDAAAIATYEAAMPGYEVFGYEGGWLYDDAIHCRTMEIPDRHMLRVDTNPLQDRDEGSGDYRVTACIDDRSEAGLVNDSLLVYWRLEGSPGFNPVVMQTTAHPDSYYADIPLQADSVEVEYYVFAKDLSGRRSARPPVAPLAWYTFNTGQDVSSVAGGGKSRTGFGLAQNSPNPFTSATEIRYELPVDCHVRLDVYDVLGKHVTTLVDEYRRAGSASLRWDARAGCDAPGDGPDLPGGVYFYMLRAGHHIETRKLVILN